MRIVQIANFVTPTSGGLRTTLEALGPRYIRAGHTCTLVIPGESRLTTVAHGVRIEHIPAARVPRSGGYRLIVRRLPLQRLLTQLQPDVLELSDKTTLSWLPAWLRRHGVPTILIAHDRHDAMLDYTLPPWLPWRSVLGSLASKTAASSDVVVCASEFAAEQFAGVPLDLRPIPLGVDLRTFHPERAFDDRMLRLDHVPLAFVGRLSPEKRPAVAIEAVRELVRRGRNVELTVVGDGPLRSHLAVSALGLPVRFVGHVSNRAAVAIILAEARTMIAPCGSETFGLAVLEAMACGTPAIVPPDGGAREIITPTTGLVVPPDAAQIADAVERLIAGDPVAQSRDCRAHAMRFPWDATATSMLDLFDRVTRNGASSSMVDADSTCSPSVQRHAISVRGIIVGPWARATSTPSRPWTGPGAKRSPGSTSTR